jgi:hypothetical protein
MENLQDENGRWYAWGEALSHNTLSMLTRTTYRCGCRLLTANGDNWVKWENRCGGHQDIDKPLPHVWLNRF